jgi:hypothetical protein
MRPSEPLHHTLPALEGIGDALLMLVDDDPLNVGMLQAHLEDAGYQHSRQPNPARRWR